MGIVPTLIRHHAGAFNPVSLNLASTTNNYVYLLPFVGAGNCLILSVSWPHSVTAPTISDNNGNTWPASPTAVADVGTATDGTNLQSAIWALPNANSGDTQIKVTFGTGLTQPLSVFQFEVSEFSNVATSSPADGTFTYGNASAPNLLFQTTATPTSNNNSSGGHLVYVYICQSVEQSVGGVGFNPTFWTTQDNRLQLLSASTEGFDATTRSNMPHATMYMHLPVQGAVQPGITCAGDLHGLYNMVGVFLKAAPAGKPAPTGAFIRSLFHGTNVKVPATGFVAQIPSLSSTRVFTCATSPDVVSDLDGDYVCPDSNQSAEIWVLTGGKPRPNNVVTAIGAGITGNPNSFHLYNIDGGVLSPTFDSADATGTATSGTLASAPSVTPTTSPGMCFGCLQLGTGPGLAVTSPTNAKWSMVTYDGEVDTDMMENADGNGHVQYTSSPGALNWTWTITANGTGWSSVAVAMTMKAPWSIASSKSMAQGGGRVGSRQMMAT